MSEDKRARLKEMLESGEIRLQPLTYPQRELWEATPVPVASPANHICCTIQVNGLLTAKDCFAALATVVERQEVLRLSILPGKDRPLQMVRKTGEPNLALRELTAEEATPEGVEAIAKEIFETPFDLLQGPLYRAQILRKAADDHVMVLAIHHSIADGWTLGVFVQDLFAAYLSGLMGIREPAPPVPLSHTAWGAAERAYWQPAQMEARAPFWRRHLQGAPRLWSQPGVTRELQPLPGRWWGLLPAELGVGIREMARRNGATLFSTLLTGFRVAFAMWNGQRDLVVGTPVANRHKQNTHETMGYFSGVVPIRDQVVPERTFAEALRETQRITTEAFAEAMPFAELVQVMGEKVSPGYHPLYEVRFALQNHPVPPVKTPNLSARLRMRSSGTFRFDLACELTEDGDALEIAWVFQSALFSQNDIERFHAVYAKVLAAAAASPTQSVAALMSSTAS